MNKMVLLVILLIMNFNFLHAKEITINDGDIQTITNLVKTYKEYVKLQTTYNLLVQKYNDLNRFLYFGVSIDLLSLVNSILNVRNANTVNDYVNVISGFATVLNFDILIKVSRRLFFHIRMTEIGFIYALK